MVEKKFQRLMIFQVSLNFLVNQLCLFTFGYIQVTGKRHLRFIDPNYMPQSSQLNSRAFTSDFRIKQYNDQGSGSFERLSETRVLSFNVCYTYTVAKRIDYNYKCPLS